MMPNLTIKKWNFQILQNGENAFYNNLHYTDPSPTMFYENPPTSLTNKTLPFEHPLPSLKDDGLKGQRCQTHGGQGLVLP